MADYISAKELSSIWGITPTRITVMCANGQLDGATKIKGRWMIPTDIVRPDDKRKRNIDEDSDANFRFIDLFAGIGGFHQAMRFLGGECVMAAEINQACVDTYNLNFKTLEGRVRGDVKKIDPTTISRFDVLCAGFPCQPFSKAGLQQGFNDKTRGNLFYSIMDILDAHPECKFVVLENVRNLADKSENWEIIRTELLKRDFVITQKPLILSPSDFGIPQIRERVYILGIKKDGCSAEIQDKGYIEPTDLNIDKYRKKCKIGDALTLLEENVSEDYKITDEQNLMIQAWDEFRLGTGIKIIGFPIWISCFGVGIQNTDDLKSSLGYDDMPDWKKRFVDKNREFYLEHNSEVTIKHQQIFGDHPCTLVAINCEQYENGETIEEVIAAMYADPDAFNGMNFSINLAKELKRVSIVDVKEIRFGVRQIQFFAAEDINPFPVIPDVVNKLSYKLDISELNSLSETDSDYILKTY